MRLSPINSIAYAPTVQAPTSSAWFENPPAPPARNPTDTFTLSRAAQDSQGSEDSQGSRDSHDSPENADVDHDGDNQ